MCDLEVEAKQRGFKDSRVDISSGGWLRVAFFFRAEVGGSRTIAPPWCLEATLTLPEKTTNFKNGQHSCSPKLFQTENPTQPTRIIEHFATKSRKTKTGSNRSLCFERVARVVLILHESSCAWREVKSSLNIFFSMLRSSFRVNDIFPCSASQAFY